MIIAMIGDVECSTPASCWRGMETQVTVRCATTCGSGKPTFSAERRTRDLYVDMSDRQSVGSVSVAVGVESARESLSDSGV